MEEEIKNFLLRKYNNNGIPGLSFEKIASSKYYNKIVELNTKNLDIQQFCSKFIDVEDEYIMYISICYD